MMKVLVTWFAMLTDVLLEPQPSHFDFFIRPWLNIFLPKVPHETRTLGRTTPQTLCDC